MVAAVVDEVDIGLLESGQDRGVVALADIEAFEHRNLDAFLAQDVADRGGDAFAVLLLVVQDRDAGRFQARDVARRRRALGVVQANGAEDHPVAACRQFRAGGGGGNHDDTFVFVDVRRRLGRAGAQVADHELDAVVDHFVGHRHRLLGVTGIVVFHGHQLLAVDATLGVDLLDGHAGTAELHVTVLRHRAGLGAGDADPDAVGRQRMAGQASEDHGAEQAGGCVVDTTHSGSTPVGNDS
ncbi:hypothetical protein D3C78_782350 [compost metagenome]